MDPYSAEGELVHMHNAFVQAQYQQVAEFDTSSFSFSNALPAQVLKLRAKIALGEYDTVLSEIKGKESSSTDLSAIKTLATYCKSPSPDSAAVKAASDLAGKQGDNLTVQLCCGTVLAAAGQSEEALALLAKHQGSLDAVALIVQIHLSMNRTDLARRECNNAKKWAQDSLLVNIAESWVGLREGGEKYQASYYVFEELAQNPSSQSIQSLLGQAVSELHLGRLPEAEAAFQQAVSLDPENPDVLANMAVLNTILGKSGQAVEDRKKLERVAKAHALLSDLQEKRADFETACKRYSPKFEA